MFLINLSANGKAEGQLQVLTTLLGFALYLIKTLITFCRKITAFLNTLMFIGYALLGMGLGFLAIFAFNGFAILII